MSLLFSCCYVAFSCCRYSDGCIRSSLIIIMLNGITRMVESIIATGQSWRVVDGDTIHMDNYKIRLLGIDAPELKQFCQTRRVMTGLVE